MATITDKDGNVYNTIVIGTQEWTVENLKTAQYADATPIQLTYEDWFLPSIDELQLMYTELKAYGVGNFNATHYWSSSEFSATAAYYFNFSTGLSGNTNKSSLLYRPIRAFTSLVVFNLRDYGPSGGLIFWKSGNDYLEAFPADPSASQTWSNITKVAIGTTGTAVGTGQSNTTKIINQVGHTTSAAKSCTSLNWGTDTTGAYCWYNNDISNKTTYGALYNWHAVNNAHNLITGQFTSGGNPSTGWKVPSAADWDRLSTYLGGTAITGGKLKEVGTTHWAAPNTGATDEVGFKALPGGFRYTNGIFSNISYSVYFWSTIDSNNLALYKACEFALSSLEESYANKNTGISIRVMRDIIPSIPVTTSSTNLTSESFSANWNVAVGAEGYYLDVSTSPTFATFVTGYNNLNVLNVLTYSVIGLQPHATYYYRVRAYNINGTSGNSNIITTLTPYRQLSIRRLMRTWRLKIPRDKKNTGNGLFYDARIRNQNAIIEFTYGKNDRNTLGDKRIVINDITITFLI